MYIFVIKPDTIPFPVTMVKSHGKKYKNNFRVTHNSSKCTEEKLQFNQEKNDGFWLLWETFNEYIKQNIIMTVLKKANFHSIDICRLMKYYSYI